MNFPGKFRVSFSYTYIILKNIPIMTIISLYHSNLCPSPANAVAPALVILH